MFFETLSEINHQTFGVKNHGWIWISVNPGWFFSTSAVVNGLTIG